VRERHLPRVCRSCRAPMARQEAACWQCGVEWTTEEEPRTTLRLVQGEAPRRAAAVDAERWTNEGGSFASG
jgi:predicted amidophosphoribosyltransferase